MLYVYPVFKQGGNVFKKTEIGDHLPDNGRVLVTCKNGEITALRMLFDDEHVTSLKSLLELAEQAGYLVVQRGKRRL